MILPYSMRGAAYGTYVFPVDGEYEFRVKVINHRDAGIDYNGPLQQFLTKLEAASLGPSIQEGAAPGGGGGGAGAPGRGGRGGGRGGRGPRAPLTPEELKAKDEKDRLAFPPERMVVTFDGKQILEGTIEGNTNYQYDRGAFIARIPVKAGEHSFRASFPELANMDDPRRNINPDGRRRLYIESMDIAGPYSPRARRWRARRRFLSARHRSPNTAPPAPTGLWRTCCSMLTGVLSPRTKWLAWPPWSRWPNVREIHLKRASGWSSRPF